MMHQKTKHFQNIYQGNIENCIGTTKMPLGLVEKLRINGHYITGVFDLPLATTEGALVASYNRGSSALGAAGGANVICLDDQLQRCPVFKFLDLQQAFDFSCWVSQRLPILQEIVYNQSQFCKLKSLKTTIEGNHCFLTLIYSTGDAAGQNMTTFCSEAICNFIAHHSPIKIAAWYIEGNFSGDKKATHQSFLQTRGKRVVAEVVLKADILEQILKTTAQKMFSYWLCSISGSLQSGAIGSQGHYANGLAALFIANGQDVACVAESAVGFTRMELRNDNALYVCVTLPNLLIGTVGGGTKLDDAKSNLALLGSLGDHPAKAFAEITAGLVLAGELSIAAAISAGHFSRAHQLLGRRND